LITMGFKCDCGDYRVKKHSSTDADFVGTIVESSQQTLFEALVGICTLMRIIYSEEFL
jgi:hypothetical protein